MYGLIKLQEKIEKNTGKSIVLRTLLAIPYFVTGAATLLGFLPGLVTDALRSISGSFWIHGPFISEGGKAVDGLRLEKPIKNEEFYQKLAEEAFRLFGRLI